MESTAWVSLYAAVVATATAGWNMFVSIRDRARLKIVLSMARFPESPERDRELLLTVTNVGRRPITVIAWGGEYTQQMADGRSEFYMRPRQMPRELREGERLSELVDPRHVHEWPVRCLWVVDSSNRKWKLSRRHLDTVATRSTVVFEQASEDDDLSDHGPSI